ncbi:hypothetical protein C8R47DRAFT_1274495 [Mycena vitilis]|nr:hypothetical protein C8R47DRAFT_1274495 [Mycena vitilis]
MLSTPFQPGRGHEGAHPEMPAPFYARRRTDPERSARIGTSGKSRLGNRTDDSPGWTPPGVRCDRGKFAAGGRWIRVWAEWGDAGTALRRSCRSGWFSAMGGKSSAGEVDPAPEREEKEKRGVASPLRFGGKALPPTPASAESPAHAPPHVIPALLREPSNILRPPLARVTDGLCLCQSAHHRRPCLQDGGPVNEARHAQTPKRPRCRRSRSLLAGLVEDEEKTLTVDDAGGAEETRIGGADDILRSALRLLHESFSNEQAKGGLRGQIEKNSSKALMHALVFATVFLRAEEDGEEAAQREKQWRDYARAALLCLPLGIESQPPRAFRSSAYTSSATKQTPGGEQQVLDKVWRRVEDPALRGEGVMGGHYYSGQVIEADAARVRDGGGPFLVVPMERAFDTSQAVLTLLATGMPRGAGWRGHQLPRHALGEVDTGGGPVVLRQSLFGEHLSP